MITVSALTPVLVYWLLPSLWVMKSLLLTLGSPISLFTSSMGMLDFSVIMVTVTSGTYEVVVDFLGVVDFLVGLTGVVDLMDVVLCIVWYGMIDLVRVVDLTDVVDWSVVVDFLVDVVSDLVVVVLDVVTGSFLVVKTGTPSHSVVEAGFTSVVEADSGFTSVVDEGSNSVVVVVVVVVDFASHGTLPA